MKRPFVHFYNKTIKRFQLFLGDAVFLTQEEVGYMLDEHPVSRRDRKLLDWIRPNDFSTAPLLEIINNAPKIHGATVHSRVFVAKAV